MNAKELSKPLPTDVLHDFSGKSGVPKRFDDSASSGNARPFASMDSSGPSLGYNAYAFPPNAMFPIRPGLFDTHPYNQYPYPPPSLGSSAYLNSFNPMIQTPTAVTGLFNGHLYPSSLGVVTNPGIDISVVLRFGDHEARGLLPLSNIYDFKTRKFLASEERAKEVGIFGVDTSDLRDSDSFGEHSIYEFARKLAPGFDNLPPHVRVAIGERVTKNHTMLKFVVKDNELFGGSSGLLLESHLTSLIQRNQCNDSPVLIVAVEKDHSDLVLRDYAAASSTKDTSLNKPKTLKPSLLSESRNKSDTIDYLDSLDVLPLSISAMGIFLQNNDVSKLTTPSLRVSQNFTKAMFEYENKRMKVEKSEDGKKMRYYVKCFHCDSFVIKWAGKKVKEDKIFAVSEYRCHSTQCDSHADESHKKKTILPTEIYLH